MVLVLEDVVVGGPGGGPGDVVQWGAEQGSQGCLGVLTQKGAAAATASSSGGEGFADESSFQNYAWGS